MGIFKPCGKGTGYFKGGLLGFPGSGKTFTAKEIAIGIRNHFHLDGPIAMFDTEKGSEYIAADVKARTGHELLAIRSRSFDDLIAASHECEEKGYAVEIVDSITHPWRDICASYLKKINDKRSRNNLPNRMRLEFQDWAPLKDYWNEKWTNWYLNSPVHVIICGRAGFDYDFRENEETGRNQLVKTGIKMKTESEFGFEPCLLIEMERIQEVPETGGRRIIHRATVLKDKFGVIQGHQADDPGFDFFKPHIELLTPGVNDPVDTEARSDVPIDEDGWPKERRQRTILCEEIKGEITDRYPGQTTKEKKAKGDVLFRHFGTRSWTKVESLDSDKLRQGLEAIKAEEISAEA